MRLNKGRRERNHDTKFADPPDLIRRDAVEMESHTSQITDRRLAVDLLHDRYRLLCIMIRRTGGNMPSLAASTPISTNSDVVIPCEKNPAHCSYGYFRAIGAAMLGSA